MKDSGGLADIHHTTTAAIAGARVTVFLAKFTSDSRRARGQLERTFTHDDDDDPELSGGFDS